MSNFQVSRDNALNNLTVTTNLKVPRYNGLPVDVPGKAGNVILNVQDNIFYGHDGITWVPFGGSGLGVIVAKAYFQLTSSISPAPTSTGDITPTPGNAWQFANGNIGPPFGQTPDIFPDFTNPYIIFPSLSGTDIELRDGVFEIEFNVGPQYNPTTSPTVIYPSIYIYDVTFGTFVGKAYETVVIPLSNPPFSSRSTLSARAVVAVPNTQTFRLYFGSFDPNTVNPTSVLLFANYTDCFVTVKRLCDV